MGYYKDLREFLGTLERNGKLLRVTKPLKKETEIGPLVWLQYRGLAEEKWKAFLFDNVTDVREREYEPKVLIGPYAASREVFALGMMCRPEEINEKWARSMANPIDPVIVKEGPVQEVVVKGDKLDATWLPLVVDEPGFSGTVRTTTQFITKDPSTGIRNVGHYSAHLRGKRKMFFGVGHGQGAHIHWQKCKAMGKRLEIAVVIGTTPNISYVSSATAGYDIDELTLAGGIAGEPVPLVKCKTVDLEVPAMAEIVIEGVAVMDRMEPFTAYGDYPGYLFKADYCPNFQVTCITHRKDPIFVTHLVGYTAQDANIELAVVNEAALYKNLKYDYGLPVLDVALHQSGGGSNYLVIQMKKRFASEPWQAMYAATAHSVYGGKVTITVDEDIDPRDPDAVNWALCFSMQPEKDVRFLSDRWVGLDPSACPPDQESHFFSSTSSAMLIDATRKFGFPPVGLPRKEYMENAIKLWKEMGLPELKLRTPWYGYELGNWTKEDREYADLIVKGEYFALADKLAEREKLV
jgi:4-hydroxy-3-polyprenylbenzoate decarboxylase